MSSKIIIMGPLQSYADTLLWQFHRSHTEMDMPSGVALDAGGARVFDALASHNAHQKMRSTVHRRACHRSQLILFALSRIPSKSSKLIEASFTSFGAGRASFVLLEASSWRGSTLIPIMLDQLSKKRHDSLPAKQSHLQILEALAHAQNLDALVTEAQAILVELVAQYANEVEKILQHLDAVADRVTSSTYRAAFSHTEH